MSTSVPVPSEGAAGVVGPTVDLYNQAVDLNTTLTPDQVEELKQNQLTSFSTVWVVVLSIVTFGIFNIIYYGLMQDRLPKVKPDDPSTGKFIVLLIIPFVNLVFTFIYWPRLADRINFQYRLRGQPAPVDRGKIVPAILLYWFGWFFFLIPGIIGMVWLLQIIASAQNSVNALAAERGA